MLHARSHLELCHSLIKSEHRYQLQPGLRLARGFADIGYEEYSVLSGYNVVSLHTGKTGTLEPDYEKFYFPVYSVDELSKLLYEKHCDIQEIRYDDQRTWVLRVLHVNKDAGEFEDGLLEGAFLKAYLWSVEQERGAH